ncbi:single-stranded DNA-binding protein [Gleimia europaea]|uniref:Single-stranded DNA-binding protein n=1 Tax=Gleimia europaea ACS-120-V-Col10b TaxID=883069 RepID=A0A9W5RFH2_9ACTO|nr:single-stranded DNA-binding protein [Gleimia europaea]EPD31321.1 single-stranded DNA-binding protein [Gleimia europaea ACS-120-V-Col10b]
MAGDTVVTIIGNLTSDPELRYTASGAPVANFTVASTPRSFDRNLGQWKDGETLFMRCSVWRDVAENVADSLTKGTRVIVQGRLQQRSYETRDGQQRTTVELAVDEIGPSLRYARAQVSRNPSNYGGGGGYNQGGMQDSSGSGGPSFGGEAGYNAAPGGAPDDPWATGGSTNFDSEPPF